MAARGSKSMSFDAPEDASRNGPFSGFPFGIRVSMSVIWIALFGFGGFAMLMQGLGTEGYPLAFAGLALATALGLVNLTAALIAKSAFPLEARPYTLTDARLLWFYWGVRETLLRIESMTSTRSSRRGK